MTEETQSLNAAFVEEGAFSCFLFQKRKHHKYREVVAPVLPGLVADTHAHLEMLKNPAAELAKCAYHNVRFVCAMCDPAEDSHTTFDNLETWQQDAQDILEELVWVPARKPFRICVSLWVYIPTTPRCGMCEWSAR